MYIRSCDRKQIQTEFPKKDVCSFTQRVLALTTKQSKESRFGFDYKMFCANMTHRDRNFAFLCSGRKKGEENPFERNKLSFRS